MMINVTFRAMGCAEGIKIYIILLKSVMFCHYLVKDVLTGLPCTRWTHSCQSEQDKWAFLLHF